MGLFLISEERTQIVLSGKLPLEAANKLFGRIRGEDLVSMQHSYDEATDQTTLRFYPCRTETLNCVSPMATKKNYDDYRILMLGKVPDSIDLIEDIWMPHRKQAKHSSEEDDLKHITCYNPRLIHLEGTDKIVTEIGFIADFRCSDRDKTIKRAAMLISEDLRTLVETADAKEMISAKLLDYITTRMAGAIQSLADPIFNDDLMLSEHSEPSTR